MACFDGLERGWGGGWRPGVLWDGIMQRNSLHRGRRVNI